MHLLFIRYHWLLFDAATEELLLREISWNQNIESTAPNRNENTESKSSLLAKYLSFV